MSRVLKDAVLTVGVRATIVVAGLATTVTTARWLGPAGRGDYFFVIAFSALASQAVHLGLHASNAYYVAQDPARFSRLAANSYWLSIALGLVSAGVGIAWSVLRGVGDHALFVLLWSLVLTPTTLATLYVSNLFVGAGRIAEYNLVQLVVALLPFVLICATAVVSVTPFAFLGAAAVASVLSHAFIARTALSGASSLAFDWPLFRQGYRYAIKAYATNALCALTLKAPALMFASRSTSVELGYFSVASQVFDTVSVVPASIAAIVFPSLMKLEAERWREARRYMWMLMALVAIASIAFACIADWFVGLAFGARFEGSVRPIELILPAAVFVSGTSILSQFLATHGMPWSTAIAWLAGAGISLAVGPVFIAGRGAMGAALTLTMASAIAWCVLFLVSSRQRTFAVM